MSGHLHNNTSLYYITFGSVIKYDHSNSVIAYYTRWYAVHSVPTSYIRYTSHDIECCIIFLLSIENYICCLRFQQVFLMEFKV